MGRELSGKISRKVPYIRQRDEACDLRIGARGVAPESRSEISYSPTLLGHIWAGIIALPAGTAAMVFRKGSSRHVLAGKIFLASMLILSIAGAYLAILKHDSDSVAGELLISTWSQRPG